MSGRLLENQPGGAGLAFPHQTATQLRADGDLTRCFSNGNGPGERILFWAPYIAINALKNIAKYFSGLTYPPFSPPNARR